MESGLEISAEKRALRRTIWSQIPRTSLRLFPRLSVWLAFILHLSHLPPACQNLHNRASIFHSIAPFSSCKLCFTTFTLPMPRPQL